MQVVAYLVPVSWRLTTAVFYTHTVKKTTVEWMGGLVARILGDQQGLENVCEVKVVCVAILSSHVGEQ